MHRFEIQFICWRHVAMQPTDGALKKVRMEKVRMEKVQTENVLMEKVSTEKVQKEKVQKEKKSEWKLPEWRKERQCANNMSKKPECNRAVSDER